MYSLLGEGGGRSLLGVLRPIADLLSSPLFPMILIEQYRIQTSSPSVLYSTVPLYSSADRPSVRPYYYRICLVLHQPLLLPLLSLSLRRPRAPFQTFDGRAQLTVSPMTTPARRAPCPRTAAPLHKPRTAGRGQ